MATEWRIEAMPAPDYIRALAVTLSPHEEYQLTGTLTPARIEPLLEATSRLEQAVKMIESGDVSAPYLPDDELFAPLDRLDEILAEYARHGDLAQLLPDLNVLRDALCGYCQGRKLEHERVDGELGKLRDVLED